MAFIPFAPQGPRSPMQRAPSRCDTSPSMSAKIPRRTFLSLAATVPLIPLFPSVSLSALSPSEALAEASQARASTDDLRTMLELEDWEAFRRALRGGPMSRVRASCSALARAQPEDSRARAESQYKRMVKAVETVDFAVLQRERGKKPDVLPLLGDVETQLDGFLKIVQTEE